MFFKWACIVVWALFSTGDSAFVDTLSKCSIKDDNCFTDLIQNALIDISAIGIEELNIPPVDPIDLKNITVSILELLNVTLEDGTVKGIKECVINKFHNNIENGVTKMEITCDLIIQGKFKVFGTSPLIQNLFGGATIHGDGNVKVKLDKIHLAIEFFYHLIKNDDGDVLFKCHPSELRYEYDVGNFKLSADKIFLGDQDASELVVGFMNQNWKLVIKTFGKNFFDVAVKLLSNFLQQFFNMTPTKYYIIEDLASYVK